MKLINGSLIPYNQFLESLSKLRNGKVVAILYQTNFSEDCCECHHFNPWIHDSYSHRCTDPYICPAKVLSRSFLTSIFKYVGIETIDHA